MLNKLKMLFKKYLFIIKEVHRSDPKIMFISTVSIIISGLSPVLTDFSISKLIKIFEQTLNSQLKRNYILIVFWVFVIILSVAADLFTNNIKYFVSDLAGYKLTHNIENLIAEKFQAIPQKTIDKPDFLDLYKNTLEQSSYAPIEILNNLFNIISSGIGLIGYLIILLQLNIYFIFLLIVFSILIYYMKYHIQNKLFEFMQNTTSKYREIQYYYDLISNKNFSNEIRLFNLFGYLKKQRGILFLKLMGERTKIINKNILCTFGITSISIIIMGILELTLIKSVISDAIFLSEFVLYNTALVSLEIGLFSFVEQIADNNSSIKFLNYLFEFLNYQNKHQPIKYNSKNIKKPYEIIFNNVSFKYPGTKNLNLKNINLKIKSGDKICLVGENGSGKTTLIKLLLRIYEPTSGTIFLNGIDIKNYNLKDYQNIFSTTFQEFIHYNLDVRSNIAFGNTKKIDDTEYLKKVAKKTNSANFIKNYPNGYETKLSKEFYDYGIEPSIGQWQKLAVSRALFKDSPILILDEPTASLDPKAEEEVFKIFDEFEKEKILLIISHRMYSAKLADKIILLSQGRILEMGSHKELINQKGKYYELYSLQAKKYKN